MSFNSTTLAVNARNRVRLKVGDVAKIPWLDDGVYNFALQNNDGNELRAAYDVLRYVESRIALEPSGNTNGFYSESRPILKEIERLKDELHIELRKAEGTYKVPIIVRTDRKDWKDIDSIRF